MHFFGDFSAWHWTLIFLSALCSGMAKAGLKGVDVLNVTFMALVFGGKASTGVILPLLCVADIFAVFFYRRHVQWSHFWHLIPWLVVGVLIAVFVGDHLDEELFRKLMAIIILLAVIIMIYLEYRKRTVPHSRAFVISSGLTTGITTMLGNLGGAFSNLYFLALRMTKQDFIGTAAWLFLVINLFKVPFHIFVWKTINISTFLIDLAAIPSLIAGFFLGLYLVKKLHDDHYRKFVIALTIVGAVMILVR